MGGPDLSNPLGMSWLQPLVREILSDQAATLHKQRFFENAATPNQIGRASCRERV